MALDKFEKTGAEVLQTIVPIKDLSDHELIEATKRGDEDAFAEIVARYRKPITNYLYRFLNDYEEAVDLAQETFVRVYFAIERYHTEYAFSTYVYRIATNLAISEIRRRKRRKLERLRETERRLQLCHPVIQTELDLLVVPRPVGRVRH